MSGQPWYKRNPLDFIQGARGLGAQLGFTYAVVIEEIYIHGGPIDNDPAWLAGLIGESGRQVRANIDALLKRGKLYLDDGRLMNARCRDELEVMARSARAQREAGKKGRASQVAKGVDVDAADNDDSHLTRGTPVHARAESRGDKIREERVDAREPDYDPSDDLIPQGKAGEIAQKVMDLCGMRAPPKDVQFAEAWAEEGLDFDAVIAPIIRRGVERERERGDTVSSFRYFHKSIMGQAAKVSHAPAATNEFESARDRRVKQWATDTACEEREEAKLAEERRLEAIDDEHFYNGTGRFTGCGPRPRPPGRGVTQH